MKFIDKYESDTRYVTRQGFKELCDEFGLTFDEGEALTVQGGQKTQPDNSVFVEILKQNDELLDYYRG